MIFKTVDAIREAKETLDRLLGEFVSGELVGMRLKKELEHIKKQIIILEKEVERVRKSN